MRFSGVARAAICLLGVLALSGCLTADRKFQRAAQGLQRDALARIESGAALDALRRKAGLAQQARRRAELTALCKGPGVKDPPAWRCNEFLGIKGVEGEEGITLDTVEVTGSMIRRSDIITNNQSSGVDEGDIVKKSGDFVLVLREGVLYSLRVERGGQPVLELADRLKIAVDDEGEQVWYDEILVAGRQVLLLGFNYGESDGVAELLRFELGADGRLARDGRFWLRTGDYFSQVNYGARLQGDNLLLSLAVPLDLDGDMQWPEWSRRDVASPRWTALLEADELMYPVLLDGDPYVHVVMQCPLSGLAGDALACRNTGIVGNAESVVYASASHAYLALAGWDSEAFAEPGFSNPYPAGDDARARVERHRRVAILRIPHDAAQPGGFAMLRGLVRNPLQLHEADDGSLFVAADRSDDRAAGVDLVRIRPGEFRASGAVPQPVVATLPAGDTGTELRFSARALWLGRRPAGPASGVGPSTLLRQPLDGSPASSVRLPQSSDMLQPAFGQMISVGVDAAEGLSFASVTDDAPARLVSTLAFPAYDAAESRSHALNFARLPGGEALLGIPGLPTQRYDERASDLLYVQWQGGRLRTAGVLDMRGQPEPDDSDCSNCFDWYGNARTFFIGGRVFALSSNLVKEAGFDGQRIVERRQLRLP